MSYDELARLVTFRPLANPFRGPRGRRHSPFKASWSKTVTLLARELRAVNAATIVLEIDMKDSDIRQDGLPRADRRAASPAVILSFKARGVHGQPDLRYEVDTFWDWQDNVRAIALGLEALRAVDRYGVTKTGEQYKGWRSLNSGQVGDGNPTHGRELIAAAGGVSKALHAAHPDHGGKPEDFRDVIAARDAS